MSDLLVLCYHTVGDDWDHPMSVAPSALRAQLAWLGSRGYRGVTFSQALLDHGSGKRVAVTFDDGFRQVHRRALPLLAELHVPATVFVPVDFVGTERPLGWPGMDVAGAPRSELLPMGWPELDELASEGWEIGSHSCSHPRLVELDDDRLQHELRTSRARCEEGLGRACRAIAYPFGDIDLRTSAAAHDAGYETGAALGRPPGRHDLMAWPRVAVYRGDSLRRFRMKTSRPPRSALGAGALRALRRCRTASVGS